MEISASENRHWKCNQFSNHHRKCDRFETCSWRYSLCYSKIDGSYDWKIDLIPHNS